MMRLYTAGNFYLSSIQQGIQALHVLGEMVATDYNYGSGKPAVLQEWLHNHKTVICLNGGTSHDLRELWLLLSDPRNTEFPVAKFNEDNVSLDGALTCVGIVLPERLYNTTWNGIDNVWVSPDSTVVKGWEAELLDVIKKLPLAR